MKAWGTCIKEDEEELAARTNLMIVDGMNFGFRFKPKSSTNIKPFASDYLKAINSLAKSYNAKSSIVVSDKGMSIYRREIYPEYKGNRDEKYANQTEEEKELTRIFFENYNEALELCRTSLPTLFRKGVEGDDIAGYLVARCKPHFDHIWLISTDGDWDTLLDENVSRFSFVTRKEYRLENFWDNHGCDTPAQFADLKAIKGDLGDNIRGVEGIGDKRGYGLLRQYGSLLDLMDQLPLPGKQAFIKNLNEARDLLERNMYLVDLPSFCLEAIVAAGQDFVDEIDLVIKRVLND